MRLRTHSPVTKRRAGTGWGTGSPAPRLFPPWAFLLQVSYSELLSTAPRFACFILPTPAPLIFWQTPQFPRVGVHFLPFWVLMCPVFPTICGMAHGSNGLLDSYLSCSPVSFSGLGNVSFISTSWGLCGARHLLSFQKYLTLEIKAHVTRAGPGRSVRPCPRQKLRRRQEELSRPAPPNSVVRWGTPSGSDVPGATLGPGHTNSWLHKAQTPIHSETLGVAGSCNPGPASAGPVTFLTGHLSFSDRREQGPDDTGSRHAHERKNSP